jgi:hypothetical protein
MHLSFDTRLNGVIKLTWLKEICSPLIKGFKDQNLSEGNVTPC